MRVLLALLCLLAPRAAPAQRLAGSRSIDGSEAPGYVAFTFDDGPDFETTPPVLDVLDEHGLKAAFFVVGHRYNGKGEVATKNRAVLTDILARGHLVGNHTFHHLNLRDEDLDTAKKDIDQNTRALARHASLDDLLFRPPFGALSADVRAALKKRGLVTVTWNVDAGDYVSRKPGKIRARVLEQLLEEGGGVVLMHDTKAHAAEAFAGVLADLEAENCRRLAAGEEPILPVELDYFAIGNDGKPLPIPDDVAARTAATRDRLDERCAVDKAPAGD